MRAFIAVLGIVMTTTSCSNEAANAERELDIVEKSGGSLDDICKAKRKVADAYLKEQDEEKYKFAKLRADIACQ